MLNFEFHNPVKLVFGAETIAELVNLVPVGKKVLFCYGGGSIKRNTVYEQVIAALGEYDVVEFGGIEPNPRYETLMRAVEIVKQENVEFLLAVGGGSVIDGVKFIAAAACYQGEDPWDILAKHESVNAALPFGCVLTLPATGSEMNGNSVVSRESTQQKLYFGSPLTYPQFSILDPETTYTLPTRQTANGVVDAFVHVMEQYMTFPVNAPLQDRMSESILLTLIEEGPKALEMPEDYDVRANLMWCATMALNNLIGCGVPQDWATHMLGHELTALYGIDHAQSLAVVLPSLLRFKKDKKREKLLQYAARIWNVTDGDEDTRIEAAIVKTEDFFNSLGVKTHLSDYNIETDAPETIGARITAQYGNVGEHADIGGEETAAILRGCQ